MCQYCQLVASDARRLGLAVGKEWCVVSRTKCGCSLASVKSKAKKKRKRDQDDSDEADQFSESDSELGELSLYVGSVCVSIW